MQLIAVRAFGGIFTPPVVTRVGDQTNSRYGDERSCVGQIFIY